MQSLNQILMSETAYLEHNSLGFRVMVGKQRILIPTNVGHDWFVWQSTIPVYYVDVDTRVLANNDEDTLPCNNKQQGPRRSATRTNNEIQQEISLSIENANFIKNHLCPTAQNCIPALYRHLIDYFPKSGTKDQIKEKIFKQEFIVQSLFLKTVSYMKRIYPYLSLEKRNHLSQIAHEKNLCVLLLLQWFGYESILGNPEDEENKDNQQYVKEVITPLKEDKLKISLAMEIVDNDKLSNFIQLSCNTHFYKCNRRRMAYTENFKKF